MSGRVTAFLSMLVCTCLCLSVSIEEPVEIQSVALYPFRFTACLLGAILMWTWANLHFYSRNNLGCLSFSSVVRGWNIFKAQCLCWSLVPQVVSLLHKFEISTKTKTKSITFHLPRRNLQLFLADFAPCTAIQLFVVSVVLVKHYVWGLC